MNLEPYEILLRNTIEDAEREVDAFEGVGPPKNVTHMRSEQKDTELLERWEGTHSSFVARAAPHLGSERAIQNIRRRNGRHGHDGRRREDNGRERAA